MKVYDNYEISPCRRFDDAGLPDPNGRRFEVCEPHQADVWTLYGHIDGEGVEAIGDFASGEDAAKTYSRITGLPFTGSYQAKARLRVMHAGPKLLEACRLVVSRWERGDLAEAVRACASAIAEADGRAA